MLTQAHAFNQRFPLAQHLETSLSLEGKQAFSRSFVQVRDVVEQAYYAEIDHATTSGERARKFLGALMNPIIGKPVKDAEQFYETFGRLMRQAWLSVSVGIYNPPIQALSDPAARLHTAQVNTVDLAWQAALSTIPEDGLIVEVGTGRGNSIARLGQMFPRARIVSITISPEQARIARDVAEKLGLANVEVRRGNIFDAAVSQDLLGQADAVGAIEVSGHFPHALKSQGIAIFASLLKPGGSLSLMDSAMSKPLNRFMQGYYENQSWYFGTPDGYLSAFKQAGLEAVSYIDYSKDTLQTFVDTTTVLRQHRAELRRDFGRAMALTWPELPATIYLNTVKQIEYVHLVGVKRNP